MSAQAPYHPVGRGSLTNLSTRDAGASSLHVDGHKTSFGLLDRAPPVAPGARASLRPQVILGQRHLDHRLSRGDDRHRDGHASGVPVIPGVPVRVSVTSTAGVERFVGRT